MKEKFKNKYNYCYDNSFILLENNLVDYVVIGYLMTSNKKLAIRHCWNVKGNLIIDSTLVDDLKGSYEYIEAFRVKLNEAIDRNYQDDLGLIKCNDIREKKLIDIMSESGCVVMPSFDSIEDLKIFRKILKNRLRVRKVNMNIK